MEKYGVAINILDKGYAVYYNADDKRVCFTATGGEVQKLEVQNGKS